MKPCCLAVMSANFYCVEKPEKFLDSNQLSYEATDVGSWYREVAGSNPVEVLKNFQASRRNRNLRSSLRGNMVSCEGIVTSTCILSGNLKSLTLKKQCIERSSWKKLKIIMIRKIHPHLFFPLTRVEIMIIIN